MKGKRPDSDRSSTGYMWKTFALYGSVGLEMGLAVALGYYLGYLANHHWFEGNQTWIEYVGLFAGFGAAAKALIRVAQRAKRDMAMSHHQEDE